MIAILAATLLLAQASTATLIDDSAEQTDAAYEQLSAGQAQAAIVRLEAALTARGTLRTRPDLWPERGGIDGFFAARFRRPGG